MEAAEEGKESPTKRTWRETETERDSRDWERDEKWREDEAEERDRLREDERDPKESFEAFGSTRNWLVKKVSNPGIGEGLAVEVAVSRSKRRKIQADPPLK